MTHVVLSVTSDSMMPFLYKGDIIIVDIKTKADDQFTVVGIKGKTIQLLSSQNPSMIFGTLISTHRQH